MSLGNVYLYNAAIVFLCTEFLLYCIKTIKLFRSIENRFFFEILYIEMTGMMLSSNLYLSDFDP